METETQHGCKVPNDTEMTKLPDGVRKKKTLITWHDFIGKLKS